MALNAIEIEDQIREALDYIRENPEVSITTAARDFGVPHSRLYARS